jgi:adenylosuccinate lyase
VETDFHRRYASREMLEIWSAEQKFRMERALWIAVMKAQSKAGLEIPEAAIKDYESKKSIIDLESIANRESILKHDVKARIEEFNSLAGHQHIHLGLTSRDVTENVEMLLIQESLELIRLKCISLLHSFGERIKEFKEIPIVARTHNVPAQVTTLGKKFSVWADEQIFSLRHLEELMNRLPIRGIKGAVGTSTDMRSLLGERVSYFEAEISSFFGNENSSNSTSQVYPRSIDFEVIATLVQLAAASNNFAINVRLLAGLGHLQESFSDSQVGSSAMPHKMNPRLSERINSLFSVLKGYLSMIENLVGEQWNEGDVSCSATRRAAISGSFLVVDGILDTAIDVTQGLAISSKSIENELQRELPIIASSEYLMLLVKKGLSRELAHKQLGKALRDYKDSGSSTTEDLYEVLSKNSEPSITKQELQSILDNPILLTGSASSQCDLVVTEIRKWVAKVKGAASYRPKVSI